jgi:hypothetical protein
MAIEDMLALRLVETEQSSTGVITSRYLPDGPVQPGSFGGHASKAEVARRRRLAAEEVQGPTPP